MISSRQEIADKIREAGRRATPQRIIIYEALWKAGSHPSAIDVHRYAIKSDPSVSLATVYNTLHLFEEINLLTEFMDGNGVIHYDPRTHPHVNLICDLCGKVEDLEYAQLDDILSDIEHLTGFKITVQTLDIRGICTDCQALTSEQSVADSASD